MLKLVAKYGDGCNLELKPSGCENKLKILNEYCKKEDRDPSQIRKSLHAVVIVGQDKDEVKERTTRFSRIQRMSLKEKLELTFKKPKKVLAHVRKRLISPPLGYVAGTPEECAERLLEFKEVGITYFMLYIVDAIERAPLRLFAKKVVPLVKKGYSSISCNR